MVILASASMLSLTLRFPHVKLSDEYMKVYRLVPNIIRVVKLSVDILVSLGT